MDRVTVTYSKVKNGFLPNVKIGDEEAKRVPLLLDEIDIQFIDKRLNDLKGKDISRNILFDTIVGAIKLSMKTQVAT